MLKNGPFLCPRQYSRQTSTCTSAPFQDEAHIISRSVNNRGYSGEKLASPEASKMNNETCTAQAPSPSRTSITLRARPAALLRNYSERVFKQPVETPQCGQAFCQACKRAKQTRCADHATNEMLLPTVLPAIDRIKATRGPPSRSNSAPQLVTAYIDCPRTEKRNKPISRETLQLLRAGMRSSCKCWLHEYCQPFFNFLAWSDLYAYLKANIGCWPAELPSYLPESVQHGILALIKPEHLYWALLVVYWVMFQLVCGYQSSLFSRMGTITTLKTRTRFSRAILEGARLAWISLVAKAWHETGTRSPDVHALCLRSSLALLLAVACTQVCHHRNALAFQATRFRRRMRYIRKTVRLPLHRRHLQFWACFVFLSLGALLFSNGMRQIEKRHSFDTALQLATQTYEPASTRAMSVAPPSSGRL